MNKKCQQPRLQYMAGSDYSNRYKQMHRWLLILGMLSKDRSVRLSAVRKQLNVSLKTIRRDLQFLEHWIPLVVVRDGHEEGRPNLYRILDDYRMPESLKDAIQTAKRKKTPWDSSYKATL